jgi:E3 ubiquitin-protein ligase RFWD2
LKVVDTLYYTERTNQGSSIVSSIEFDRDQEFFAAGGVTKEIKIYDLSMILDADRRSDEENLILHCPVKRLTCGHKISCLSWSSYIKSQLASSDYEGVIDVWDVMTGQKVRRFHEHSRRAWSVDISTINPQLIASGSDDNTAKIWSTSSSVSNAIHTLELKGNVCCAKFAPHDANLLAVGCAG